MRRSDAIIGKLIGLIVIVSLMGSCTSEVEGPKEKKSVPIQVVSYVAPYDVMDQNPTPAPETRGIALTRSEWLPSGYSAYTNFDEAIGLFFTQDSPAEKIEEHRVWYNLANDKWRIPGDEVQAAGSYLLYGYTPYNAGSASISKNTTFTNGAVMTISGLSTVMDKDLCVLVGATDGTNTGTVTFVEVTGLIVDESSVTGLYVYDGTSYILTSDTKAQNETTYYRQKELSIGAFDCILKDENETTQNYIYLLFDHLYAEIDFLFRVDEKYDNLRSIRLKRIEATTYTSSDFSTTEKKPLKATVTLQANNTGTSPITGLTFSSDESSSESLEQGVLLYEKEETTEADNLPCLDVTRQNKVYSERKAYILSNAHRYFELRTTYDIYDTKGNLIRKDCEATNRINTQSIFKSVDELERGSRYQIRLTVAPTYLYVLSEPDLDNPSVSLE